MILSKVNGGLGNQLFQVAAGIELADRLDRSYLSSLAASNFYPKWRYKSPFVFGDKSVDWSPEIKHVVSEADFFSPTLDTIDVPIVLDGYFQSPSYHKNTFGKIKNVAHFRSKFLNSTILRYMHEIKAQKTLFFHMRRGDYIEETALDFHGLVSENAVIEVVKSILSETDFKRVIGFGDDKIVVDQVIDGLSKSSAPSIKFYNMCDFALSDLETLYLMMSCKGAVIANSSFSWWGARLSFFRETEVFFPKFWFNGIKTESLDLVLDEWRSY